MFGKKIQIYGAQLVENALNLEIFTRVLLQAKLSSKFLSPPPSLIQIHTTAIKHKQSQVVYTYQFTTSRYSCVK